MVEVPVIADVRVIAEAFKDVGAYNLCRGLKWVVVGVPVGGIGSQNKGRAVRA